MRTLNFYLLWLLQQDVSYIKLCSSGLLGSLLCNNVDVQSALSRASFMDANNPTFLDLFSVPANNFFQRYTREINDDAFTISEEGSSMYAIRARTT